MQLADLVAHAFFRAYNAGDDTFASTCSPALLAHTPARIVHFTSDAGCQCAACATERAAAVAAS
jgi:hypothetical protein